MYFTRRDVDGFKYACKQSTHKNTGIIDNMVPFTFKYIVSLKSQFQKTHLCPKETKGKSYHVKKKKEK